MENPQSKLDRRPHSFNADIPSEWVRGTDINYRRAQRQAVEIDLSQNFYLYPENGLRFVGNGEFPSDIERYKYITASAFGEREHKPHKLWPQTGTEGFTAAAEASATKISDQDMQTVRIPHQYILFSPAALRPTKEFKEAVQYALEVPLDNKKFLGLQQVFKEFGYYYPYWIATGGDVNLLINGPDIEGWFKSGTTNPDFLVPLDINPIYDLLDDEIRSEVKRVYQTQYAEPISRINPHPGSRGNISMALSRLSKLRHHIGIAKGVQFGGDQSEEDVVELKNNSDISKLMKLTSVGGKPRIECEVHRTILGTDSSTHAFLHNAFSGYAVGSSGFMRSAISSHIERNGGELQPATQGVTYFVMYVTYREVSILWKKESNLSDFLWASVFDQSLIKGTDNLKNAVSKALQANSDKEKYKALQEVFGHFGYFYPSVISLGGRVIYETCTNDPPESWMTNNGIATIDRALKKGMLDETTGIEAIGGSAVFAECQDWIDSVKTNCARIQFRSLRPMYELLDEEQRLLVRGVYDGLENYTDDFPELSKGVHLDGTQGHNCGIELARIDDFSKMVMLRKFLKEPHLEHVERYAADLVNITKCSLLDVETPRELPGSYGFKSGAIGMCKEMRLSQAYHGTKTENLYNTAYVVHHELNLYDEFIQATDQFKEAINKALQVGSQHYDEYGALQDVFQQFGYYYPSCIQFGGRISYEAPLKQQEKQQRILQKIYPGRLLETSSIMDGDGQSSIKEVTPDTANFERSTAIAKVEKSLSKNMIAATVGESLKKSDIWNAIGGNSQLLLWSDIKAWTNTIDSNPVIVQFKGLKPLYELLDKEQRCKVQEVYENMIMEDDRICYDYLTKIITRGSFLQEQAQLISQAINVSVFRDSDSAIEFCRNACADTGFAIVEEASTDKVRLTCRLARSMDQPPKGKTQGRKLKHEQEQLCQWGVLLIENDESQWQFCKFANPEESEHNHNISSSELDKDISDTTDNIYVEMIIGTFIRIIPDFLTYDLDSIDAQYVRYGDIVQLQHIRNQGVPLFTPNEEFIATTVASENGKCGVAIVDPMKQKDKEISDLDFKWKVIRCLEDGDNEKNTHSQYTNIHEVSDEATRNRDNDDYIRKGDIVAFESQRTINGSKKVYLNSAYYRQIGVEEEGISPSTYDKLAWHIEPLNEYKYRTESSAKFRAEKKEREELMVRRQAADLGVRDALFNMGYDYVYGVEGLEANEPQAIEYLTKASNMGHGSAYYELGKIMWSIGEHEKAINMFEEASLFPMFEACRELGDIYHTGFLSSHSDSSYAVPQDYKKAFMYYSIAAIFGDSKAALAVGAYFEKGYHSDFGVNHDKALQWYELARKNGSGTLADLEFGKLKHTMANASRDPTEAEELRKEAYTSFARAAISEPYAKFMVAVYHMSGWGGQEIDTALGFEMLLGLAESGLTIALLGISKCYKDGIGVEPDLSKSRAFRELATRMEAQ
ncbi:hypothetical protein DFQ30_002680 [Apophysomyces sp. BC1015]|nr:hypothetical protein DFQ30_002680 [Apophysomyces sp. BC1015]